MSKKKNTNDCHELKNIQYKTLLMKGTNLKQSNSTNDLSNIDLYLTNEDGGICVAGMAGNFVLASFDATFLSLVFFFDTC